MSTILEPLQDIPKWDPSVWKEDKSHKPMWYIPTLENVDDSARELLETYSKVPKERVISHIMEVRDRAFDIFPYPCIGLFRFLDLSIRKSPEYPEVLQRVKNGQKFLDLGCCFGQDIRKLVSDGAPSENTYGADLQMEFMNLGYDLFLDKDTLKTKFIASDIFDPGSDFGQLNSSIDIVNAASFFHLFDWEQQVWCAKRVTEILKDVPGVLVIGRQMGSENAGPYTSATDKKTRYWHNEESFKRMWKQVGDETGSEWEVDVRGKDMSVDPNPLLQMEKTPIGTKSIAFTVRRV